MRKFRFINHSAVSMISKSYHFDKNFVIKLITFLAKITIDVLDGSS
jgi:hypothetical protein